MAEFAGRDLRSRADKRFRDNHAKYGHGRVTAAAGLSELRHAMGGPSPDAVLTPRQANRQRYEDSRPGNPRYVYCTSSLLQRGVSESQLMVLKRKLKEYRGVPAQSPRLHFVDGATTGRKTEAIDDSLESKDEVSGFKPTRAEIALSRRQTGENADADILYSFEKRRASPNADGEASALDTLVDRAEEKWENGKIDRIVKEYEVLDKEGEKVRLSAKKGKGKEQEDQQEGNVGIGDDEYEVI